MCTCLGPYRHSAVVGLQMTKEFDHLIQHHDGRSPAVDICPQLLDCITDALACARHVHPIGCRLPMCCLRENVAVFGIWFDLFDFHSDPNTLNQNLVVGHFHSSFGQTRERDTATFTESFEVPLRYCHCLAAQTGTRSI